MTASILCIYRYSLEQRSQESQSTHTTSKPTTALYFTIFHLLYLYYTPTPTIPTPPSHCHFYLSPLKSAHLLLLLFVFVGIRWYRDPKKAVPLNEITRFPHAVLEVCIHGYICIIYVYMCLLSINLFAFRYGYIILFLCVLETVTQLHMCVFYMHLIYNITCILAIIYRCFYIGQTPSTWFGCLLIQQ